jgi:tol-pal system protein YbgF
MSTTYLRRLGRPLLVPAVFSGLCALALGPAGCVTTDEGRRMQEQIDQLLEKSKKNEAGGVELAGRVQQQSEELRRLLDEAKRLTTNLANASQKAEQLQADLMQVQGKFDDMQRQLDALQKSFTEYRAQSDTKLEQLVNATTVAKAPPLPDNPEAMFAEGQRKFVAGQWNDARRVFDAFVNRYPGDQRASKAQFLIGDAYFSEGKFANAIGAFTKVIDNFPKSEDVEAAMFKNGKAFFSLRYCNEAKTYFQELIRRYPKTTFKSDASEQIKEISKQAKNKAACQS